MLPIQQQLWIWIKSRWWSGLGWWSFRSITLIQGQDTISVWARKYTEPEKPMLGWRLSPITNITPEKDFWHFLTATWCNNWAVLFPRADRELLHVISINFILAIVFAGVWKPEIGVQFAYCVASDWWNFSPYWYCFNCNCCQEQGPYCNGVNWLQDIFGETWKVEEAKNLLLCFSCLKADRFIFRNEW